MELIRRSTLSLCVACLIALEAISLKGAELDREFAWRLEGGKATVYLIGSIHLLRSTDLPLAPIYQSIFDEADIVYFEADVDRDLSAIFLEKLIIYPPGESIHQDISSITYNLLVEYAQSTGYQFDLTRNRPWFHKHIISQQEYAAAGFFGEHGVDRYFLTAARNSSKEVRFLETIEFQLEMIAGFPAELQDRQLRELLEDRASFGEDLRELAELWKSGDKGKLAELVAEMDVEEPLLHQKMLVDRNVAWVGPIVDALTGSETTVFIVGAAHFVGEQGVIQLIRDRGYYPIQLPEPPAPVLAIRHGAGPQLHITGTIGCSYFVQSTDNVSSGRWQTMSTVTMDDSATKVWSDLEGPLTESRFYRAMLVE